MLVIKVKMEYTELANYGLLEATVVTGKNELLERIERQYDRMSKSQKKLADYIRSSYEKAVFMTAARLERWLESVSLQRFVLRWALVIRGIRSSRRRWRSL